MQIAIPIYPAFTALDAIGPYEVLQRLPGAEVVFCSERAEVVRTEQGMLGISADRTLEEVDRPDIVVVPGGSGTRFLLDPDGPYASWIARVHETTTWTTSVCTGSLLLAAAGVLDGVDATTHWAARGLLGELGANPVAERVVERGQGDHRRRRLVRHRHGAATGRADGRPGGRAGHPARDRVRPRPTPRHGIAGEGAAGDRRADRASRWPRRTVARSRCTRWESDRQGRFPAVSAGPTQRARSSAASSRPAASTSATTSARSASTSTGQEQLRGAGEEAIYCIVDLHAITVAYDPAELRERVHDTTAILLAAGLDPDRCVLFRQGDVREHSEL